MNSDLIDVERKALQLRNAGQLKEAAELFAVIVKEQPDWEHGMAFYNMACCYEDLGELVLAEKCYRDALVHEPKSPYFIGGLASFLYLHGDTDKAFAAYLTLLEVERTSGNQRGISTKTMKDTGTSWTFQELSEWHREILSRLLDAPFPGQPELKTQILTSRFRVVDNNQSLKIFPTSAVAAPVVKTIPVEASAPDEDGVPIQSLLLTTHGLAYMLEILRADGERVKRLPSAPSFKVIVLGV